MFRLTRGGKGENGQMVMAKHLLGMLGICTRK